MVEPCHDIAHLAHVELLTDRFEDSLDFFTRVYGLSVSAQTPGVAYLRGFDDYEFHSLKLTAADTTGIGHVAYRATSPEALERRVAAIEKLGGGIGWVDGDEGHGRAYRFHDPDGHVFEIYYDTRRAEPGDGEKAALKNIASRYHGRGVCVRRIDHL
ncbi:VOC family protein, partial [Devosia sp.]|uniref:VOC family protein n=1 Tax=Devosia sp. TaxID=1871048 RepID=UPI002AFE40A1